MPDIPGDEYISKHRVHLSCIKYRALSQLQAQTVIYTLSGRCFVCQRECAGDGVRARPYAHDVIMLCPQCHHISIAPMIADVDFLARYSHMYADARANMLVLVTMAKFAKVIQYRRTSGSYWADCRLCAQYGNYTTAYHEGDLRTLMCDRCADQVDMSVSATAMWAVHAREVVRGLPIHDAGQYLLRCICAVKFTVGPVSDL